VASGPTNNVERRGEVGIVGAEHLFGNGQRAPINGFRLIITSGGAVELRQPSQGDGDAGMIRAEGLLEHRQRPLRQWNSLSESALLEKLRHFSLQRRYRIRCRCRRGRPCQPKRQGGKNNPPHPVIDLRHCFPAAGRAKLGINTDVKSKARRSAGIRAGQPGLSATKSGGPAIVTSLEFYCLIIRKVRLPTHQGSLSSLR
jgi:hypothetical protein